MPLGKRKRKILLAVGLLVGGSALLWISLPLWFPWALRPAAQRQGIHYARYERQGWGQFTLHQVGFTNQHVQVSAQKVEAALPIAWFWHVLNPGKTPPVARVTQYDIFLPSSPGKTTTPTGRTNRFNLTNLISNLQRWIPAATLSNGTIRAEKFLLALPTANWSAGQLSAELRAPQLSAEANLIAGLDPKRDLVAVLHSAGWQLDSTNTIAWRGAGFELQSQNQWLSNRISFQAHFKGKDLLPEKASLQASNIHWPASLARGQPYEDVAGSVSAHWENRAFTIDAEIQARAAAIDTNFPPFTCSVHARGDTNGAVIESASLTAPWLNAQLSSNLNLYFTGQLLREPARLALVADLSGQPWFPLQGVLRGNIEAQPAEGKYPHLDYNLTASEIVFEEIKANTVQARGTFAWPALDIAEARAAFEDGSTIRVGGRLDCSQPSVSSGSIELEGPLFQRWLPEGYSYADLALSANLDGPFDHLQHQGRLVVRDLTGADIQPLQLQLDWSGSGPRIDSEITTHAGNSSLTAKAAAQFGQAEFGLNLSSCIIRRANATLLELQTPARCRIQRTPRLAAAELTRVKLKGSAGEIGLEGSWQGRHQGAWQAMLNSLHPELFQDFVKAPIEPIEVRRLVCRGGWTNGPLRFELQLVAAGQATSQLPLGVEANLRGDESGLILSNLTVTSQTTNVAQAHGLLPVRFDLTQQTNVISFESGLPLQLSLRTQPEAFFWNKFAEWSGVAIQGPECNIELSGSWAAPQGSVRVKVDQFHFRNETREMPRFERLRLNLELTRDRARLTEGIFFVQNQPVSLSGEIPLGAQFWTDLKQKKIPNWERASGRVRVEEAEVAAFAALLPSVLAPQGTLALECELAPGGKLGGQLTLHQARTRPLGNVGPVRDIETRLTFENRALKLERATANVGGAAVVAVGQADLTGTEWLKGAVPPFQFKLQGTNVPLSRQPESILRSDLDLTVTKTNKAPALISGTARLRDSFYLSNLQDLVPGNVASPKRRPPYFSVELEPFADWRVVVQVAGKQFLRVRSTLFNGEVSANLKLEGTLRDPVAVGDVRVDSGMIRFPFASLKVQSGFVTLSLDNPHRPQLSVRAGSKKFGYDVQLEASGPVDAPVLQFSSIPPLSSEQIVLMLTAGELPKGELSLTPQQKAQTVAVFFGRDLLERFGLGDDSEERLSLQSGEQVSEKGRPTYSLEYKLTERWSLTGEYDRFNEFNAGLKWKVFSR